MAISVTDLKLRCLEIIREVERQGTPVEIARHGRIVARILPAIPGGDESGKPWMRLHGTGELLGSPEESVLEASDFEATR